MQICSTCLIEKPLSLFSIHSNGKLRKQCKLCKKNGTPESIKNRHQLKKYYLKNYEKHLGYSKNWRKNNLQYDAFRAATYRAEKAKRTPTWANKDKIKEIYLLCPEGYHVDHIIPLRGKYVSGLHVESNLQYLPAKENLKKRNNYDMERPLAGDLACQL